MMFGYGHSGWADWEIVLMWAGMVALVALLVWALTRTLSGRRGDGPGDDPAAPGRILDDRLARGEIDADQYTRLRDALNSGSAKRPAGAGSRNLGFGPRPAAWKATAGPRLGAHAAALDDGIVTCRARHGYPPARDRPGFSRMARRP